MNIIRYTIVPKNPAAHLFEVTLTVAQPDPSGQRFVLPVWIPGSYMIREFARNIVTLQAFNAAGRKLAIDKTDKHAWATAPHDGPITLRYEVYGWDLSVRAAETLRAANRVVAEDTRRTRQLLTHIGISGKPIDRIDEHARDRDVAQVVEALVAGARVALVTDAGTPVVSP